MSVVLRFAWRDARGSRLRMVSFVLAMVIGLAAVAAALTVQGAVSGALQGETKQLLGADLELSSKDPLPPEILQLILTPAFRTASEERLRTMARFSGGANRTDANRLVQLRAYAGQFPLYGTLEATPEDAWRRVLGGERGVVIDQSLAEGEGLTAGASLQLGSATFPVLGVLASSATDGTPAYLFAPRVYMSSRYLAETGLLGFGSLVDRQWYIAGESTDIESLTQVLTPLVQSTHIDLTTVQEREQLLGASVQNAATFFALVGVAALLLGALGSAATVRLYLLAKLPTIGLVKCLGVQTRFVTSWLGVQIVGSGLVAALLGAWLGQSSAGAIAQLVPAAQALELSPTPTVRVTLIVVGLGITVLVALCLPVLEFLRRTSPLVVLRPQEAAPSRIAEVFSLLLTATIVAALSLTISNSYRITGIFIGSLVAAALLLIGLGVSLQWGARMVQEHVRPTALRFGIRMLGRSGPRGVVLLVAFGVGIIPLQTILLLEGVVRSKTEEAQGAQRPNLFFFDVQSDQRVALREQIERHQGQVAQEVPVVLMRLLAVAGRPVREILGDPQSTIPAWTLKREYWSSYRSELAENERLVGGTWVPRVPAGTAPIPISIEDRLAQRLQVALGDTLLWDVQGVELTTQIASVRDIFWERLERNSFVVFPEGVLEEAPQTLFVAARIADGEIRRSIRRAVGEQLPNISVLDVDQIVQTVDGILARLLSTLRIVSITIVAAAALVIFTTVGAALTVRVREMALFRILGARRLSMIGAVLVEQLGYATLGCCVGSLLALAVGTVISHTFFDALPVVSWWELLLPVLLVLGTVAIVGFLFLAAASRRQLYVQVRDLAL